MRSRASGPSKPRGDAMNNDPTDDYFFLALDIREDGSGGVRWPYIRKDDSQNLDWWSQTPVRAGKPIDFSADPDYPNDVATFQAMQVAAIQGFPLVRPGLGARLSAVAPPSAQLIPSYIKTSRGPYDWDEDWLFLHLWDMRDIVDRARSTQTMVDGLPFGTFDSIRLDARKMAELAPEERGIVRLASEEQNFAIFHRHVAEIMLDCGLAGAVLVPLTLYAPVRRYMTTHRALIDEINGLV